TAWGSAPTLMARPAFLVTRSTGVTVPDPEFATNAVGWAGRGPGGTREAARPGAGQEACAAGAAAADLRAGCAATEPGRTPMAPPRTGPNTSLTGRAYRSLRVSV